ncbi:MAG: sulfite exporter TauE/SafE family protein [Promethearchaeota archaeon]
MDPLIVMISLLSVPIGILIGLGAGVVGLTAWPLLVPLLLVFGGFPLHEALLSSLLVDLVIAVILTIFYVRFADVEVDGIYGAKLGTVAGITAIITVIIAFPLLEQYSDVFKGGSTIVTMLLGVFFIIQGVRMKSPPNQAGLDNTDSSGYSRLDARHNRFSQKQKNLISYGFCAVQGLLTGAIAIGGAMNIVLVLAFLVGYPTLRAVGTAMVTTTIMLSATVLAYAVLLEFTLSTLPIVVLYVIVGGISCLIAVMRVQSIPERRLRLTIGVVVMTAALFAAAQVFLLG